MISSHKHQQKISNHKHQQNISNHKHQQKISNHKHQQKRHQVTRNTLISQEMQPPLIVERLNRNNKRLLRCPSQTVTTLLKQTGSHLPEQAESDERDTGWDGCLLRPATRTIHECGNEVARKERIMINWPDRCHVGWDTHCHVQGSHTFSKTIFHTFSISNLNNSLPSFTFIFRKFYSRSTSNAKTSTELSSALKNKI